MRPKTVCDSDKTSNGNSGIRANGYSDDGSSNDYQADCASAVIQTNKRSFGNPNDGRARRGYAQANQGPTAVADKAADSVG